MKKQIKFELSDYVLEKYFLETGARQGWNNKNVVVLAVSGGGDSVALLWLFYKFFKGKIFVVHVNHGIREKESDEDENFVAKISKEFGAEFFSEKINVNAQKLKGESIETAARRLRREIICEIVKSKI
ncbi:MAG: tRNA lysidine(34) synthetase TilS, partial [Synergistaceae bacterium]|nr:tRNA lysidine(34) synthetase TilS [Synergistaceae bacterium]